MLDDSGDVFAGTVADPERHLERIQRQVGGPSAIVRHPTIRRENTSVTKAVNAIPNHVGT